MSKILIIGGGFGGLSAASRLYKLRDKLSVTLIDKKDTVDFLPMLPDCIGRGICPQALSYKIEKLARKFGFKFILKEVTAIDLDKKEASAGSEKFNYDYLIIASGSETNFYGNDNIKERAYTLDSVNDSGKIIEALRRRKFDNFIVGGGGYTGIEVATNLRLFLKNAKSPGRIIIVERSPAILGPLPEWMKKYVISNLKRLEIEVFVNSTIDKIEEDKVYFSEGRIINNAFTIWAAGVKTAGFIQDLKIDKNPQGRIKVDEYLRLNDSCFIAGDAANFSYKNIFLRMAVQFAIIQGDSAAANIIRDIKGLPLRKYRPLDLGYIIPMANNRSCGRVLGLNMKGVLPTIFHFIMCIYRSYGLKNKFAIIRDLIKGGRK
ncbi:MAG: FAD-dependent oxidoreductase [Candidatus Omnitrophica bacterium]|nr:FAD-dependent oxidoreductase [Candidatus Omnitrophota bacterium]